MALGRRPAGERSVGATARRGSSPPYATAGSANLRRLLPRERHALHATATRTRPAFLGLPDEDTGYAEGMADLLGWDATEPAWQAPLARRSGRTARGRTRSIRGLMLDVCWALFELSSIASRDRRPNDVWTEITSDGPRHRATPRVVMVGGARPADRLARVSRELRAVRADAAGLRARLLELRGPWWDGDPGWFAFVARAVLFAPGRRGRRLRSSKPSSAVRSPPRHCSPISGVSRAGPEPQSSRSAKT
jgi:hypothetical protein